MWGTSRRWWALGELAVQTLSEGTWVALGFWARKPSESPAEGLEMGRQSPQRVARADQFASSRARAQPTTTPDSHECSQAVIVSDQMHVVNYLPTSSSAQLT